MFFSRRGRGGAGGGGEAVATRNILNGVLSCAWDKTSYSPKLLEIYENSQVKFNIDADNPLTMAFANGWDDKDRPAQVVKTLATAPSNIDLSGKANCHVQIVAKAINDELVITTNDVYDPGWEIWTNAIPAFTSDSAKDGWSISAANEAKSNHPNWHAVDGNVDTRRETVYDIPSNTEEFYITAPRTLYLNRWGCGNTKSGDAYKLYMLNPDTLQWVNIDNNGFTGAAGVAKYADCIQVNPATQFRITITSLYGTLYDVRFYEQPTAKFFRGLNKVKDRSDVEQLWINLGYATVDASGNITALNHYTDLRNNYPGGMRVEA